MPTHLEKSRMNQQKVRLNKKDKKEIKRNKLKRAIKGKTKKKIKNLNLGVINLLAPAVLAGGLCPLCSLPTFG